MNANEIKDILQEKWSNTIIDNNVQGLVHIAPRCGKSQTALKTALKIKAKNILVAYPDNKIKNSWEEDIKKLSFNENIIFTTYLSIHKHIGKYDLVILDEIHLTSEAQREEIKKLLSINKKWIGLSGSLGKETIKEINTYFKAKILIEYSIEKAISDGIISNYEIYIVKCKLDKKHLTPNSKGKMLSEKEKYDNLTYVIEKLIREGKSYFMLALSRMRILQASLGKLNKTKELLEKYKNERILIFTGLTKTANSLGVNVHHSKNENEEEFIQFALGKSKFNHLAVVKIGNSGVNFYNLDKIILNSFDSNEENTTQKICRCLLLEDNPNKISQIYIITTDEEAELKKLKKSLQMFKQSKINYYE